jgi:hypothetical protein
VTTATIHIVGRQLPGATWDGRHNIHVGVQRRNEVIDLVRADVPRAEFDVPVDVIDGDYRGPSVHGPREQRFVYLSWGERAPDGTFTMFRRAKLRLRLIPQAVADALAAGTTVQADLALTDVRGGPIAASVPSELITWRVAD